MLSREEMIERLTDYVCRVVFTKVSDGTERIMLCTLKGSLIPAEKFPDHESRPQSNATIRCFDIEKQEFRSFRVDSVTDFAVGA